MKVQFVGFGEVEIDGKAYDHDIVIDNGKVRKRKKRRSKTYREAYGHTPVSAKEEIPWGGKRLIIGTGAYGRLPIMTNVFEEAAQRGIEIVAVPTSEACNLVSEEENTEVRAILHVTC